MRILTTTNCILVARAYHRTALESKASTYTLVGSVKCTYFVFFTGNLLKFATRKGGGWRSYKSVTYFTLFFVSDPIYSLGQFFTFT